MRPAWPCAGLVLLALTPCHAQDARKAERKSYQVPYTLSGTKHILVRAKINGKGPFNFILDTGAPALFVVPKVCRRLDVEPDSGGWAGFDRFEIEGGVVLTGARGRVEEPPQLTGMNSLGLAGAEWHGVIGYSVIARFRTEIDLTRDKMTWTELDHTPPSPQGLGHGRAAPPDLAAVGGMAKALEGLFGKVSPPGEAPRGFLGVEVDDGGGQVAVKAVLPRGPAARAGLKPGDAITHFDGTKVAKTSDLYRAAAALTPGRPVKLTVRRGSGTREIALTAGEGL